MLALPIYEFAEEPPTLGRVCGGVGAMLGVRGGGETVVEIPPEWIEMGEVLASCDHKIKV